MIRVAVTFNRTWRMYQKGETAGFPAKQADDLKARGIARAPGTAAPVKTETPDRVSSDALSAPLLSGGTVAFGKASGDGNAAASAGDGADQSAGAPPKQGRRS
ncbi:hypothetical protein [Chachezhania sediminis]|uniref:hypothetical protein n=1 Tax=Chachezhania sediminis TaxID=2599291 RepID=UPI00131B27EF|nr:hypothetical protein [Chachezhania sediminis]